jgi:cytochrome c oxidase subunit IV
MSHSQEPQQKMKPNYLGVFIALAVLTAIEIGVTYLPLPRIPVLIPLALIKAALVVMFYMHLKFDKRVYTLIFGAGLLMGLGLILSLIVLFLLPGAQSG